MNTEYRSDAVTGERLARDHDPGAPELSHDLTCPGLGAGFSPTGRTLAAATSSDPALWAGGGHGRG